METSKENVEVCFIKPRVRGFLEDLIQLCIKHNISIDTDIDLEETMIEFFDWDCFTHLEVDKGGASLY